MSFAEIWERVVAETDLKKLTELAELVGTTQQYISRKKGKDEFSIEWAYKIGQKYGLLTEWIMTGTGPKRINEKKDNSEVTFEIIRDLNQWLTELVVNEPTRRDWFSHEIQDKLPMFKEWKKRRDQQKSRDSESARSHIA